MFQDIKIITAASEKTIVCNLISNAKSIQNTNLIDYYILYANFSIYKQKMNDMDNADFLSYLTNVLNHRRKHLPCKASRKNIKYSQNNFKQFIILLERQNSFLVNQYICHCYI